MPSGQMTVPPKIRPKMSSTQEITNAITMMFPVALSWLFVYICDSNIYTLSLAIGTTIHFPASFGYHLHCCFSSNVEQSEIIKKIDISMIHISSVFYAFATSKSQTYAMACFMYSLLATWHIWKQKGLGIHKVKRAVGVCASVILYTSPIAHQNAALYPYVMSSFACAGAVYIMNTFGGWSHTIFHMFLVLFQYYMLCSTRIIDYRI